MRSIASQLVFTALSLLPKCIRYHFWMSMYKIGRRIWPDCAGSARKIPFGMYLKHGWNVFAQEGHATRYISQHTNVPVPNVYDIVEYNGETLIAMSELPGDNLGNVGSKELSSEQREYVAMQLRTFFEEIRALHPRSGAVCGFGGTPIRDSRISMDLRPFGPFDSIQAFHSNLVRVGMLAIPDEKADEVNALIREAHSRPHRLCLTHGDLHPDNVLIDDQCRITGIVDWESAGWMPEYWDFMKACFIPWYRKGAWFDIMRSVFPSYDLEYRAERLIWKYRQLYN